jgi:hypothetical protein
MKKTRLFYALAILGMMTFAASCKPDQPVDPNEEELITKVQLTFIDASNATNTFTAIYSDPDGDGGAAPVRFDSITLDSGKTYNVRVALYDESDPNNIGNITDEVQAEADQHLFCFTATGVNITVQKTDSDGTFPIGITSNWTAGGPGTGTMRVELRHQPDGQKDGTCTPGATDVQLDFPVVIN